MNTHVLDPELWRTLLRPPDRSWRRRALEVWTAAGVAGLIALAWAEPFTAHLTWAPRPLVMALRGVLLVEAFGYAYHRFFQHVGRFTRSSATARRNQMYHWLHHMVIYPIGRRYKRDTYVAAETGLALSWVVPGWIAAALALWTHGFTVEAGAFIAGVGLYAKLVVDLTHARFHLERHPWAGSRWFRRISDIHLLHHWDQGMNFTIVHPLMDRLFGTFLEPDAHRAQLAAAYEDGLTLSDAVNWRYLLKEATPAEHAAFISQARRHPRSVRKLELLLACLERRLARFPGEAEASDLRERAGELLALVRPLAAA